MEAPGAAAWVDCGPALAAAAAALSPAAPATALVHEASYDADLVMNVIVMMEPKLDPGASKVELPSVGALLGSGRLQPPGALTPAAAGAALDRLLQCLVAWMRGSSLPQSVAGCLWTDPVGLATLAAASGQGALWRHAALASEAGLRGGAGGGAVGTAGAGAQRQRPCPPPPRACWRTPCARSPSPRGRRASPCRPPRPRACWPRRCWQPRWQR